MWIDYTQSRAVFTTYLLTTCLQVVMQVVGRQVEKESKLANPHGPKELEPNRKLFRDGLPFILRGAPAGAGSVWGYYIDCYLGPSTVRRCSQIWQFQSRKVENFKDSLFSPRDRILVIHARIFWNRTNYCKEERPFVMGNLGLYHNLLKFCSSYWVSNGWCTGECWFT